jgi:uncharacterized membrane protein YkvA (DUF1232 family)
MIDLKSKAHNLIQMAKKLFGNQVEAIAKQEAKARILLSDVGQKLVKASKNSKIQQVVEPISIFIRMVKAHFSGTHKLSNSTLGMVLLALVYFLSPFDLMPDFLGLVGFVDDASVVLAVYAKIKTEVNGFLEWEKIQSIP